MNVSVNIPKELQTMIDLLAPVKNALYEASKVETIPVVVRCIRMTDERLDEAFMWASQAGQLSAVLSPERNTVAEEALSSGKVINFPQK